MYLFPNTKIQNIFQKVWKKCGRSVEIKGNLRKYKARDIKQQTLYNTLNFSNLFSFSFFCLTIKIYIGVSNPVNPSMIYN